MRKYFIILSISLISIFIGLKVHDTILGYSGIDWPVLKSKKDYKPYVYEFSINNDTYYNVTRHDTSNYSKDKFFVICQWYENQEQCITVR